MTVMLERWDTCADRRAVFLHHWATSIDLLLRAVRNGRFNDTQWTLRLLEQLSEYYFITVEPDGDDLTLVTPPAWRVAHEAALMAREQEHTLLMLGYNALISNDVPQAVCDVLTEEWPLGSVRLEQRYQDFCIVGDIVTGAFSEDASIVSAWIDDVWNQTLTLLTAPDHQWRDVIREALEDTALRRAHLLSCDIEHRLHLLRLPAARLDQLFPARHDGSSCHLSVSVPTWGEPAPTAT